MAHNLWKIIAPALLLAGCPGKKPKIESPPPVTVPGAPDAGSDLVGQPPEGQPTPEEAVQFERQGYFCRDPDSAPGRLVFNRTIGLRDTWAKEAKAG